MKKGFTLIELLVVVLIIGILSSIALPQYQKSVDKSRAAAVWPVLKTYKTAADACELAEGNCGDVSSLDVTLPNTPCKFSFFNHSCSFGSYKPTGSTSARRAVYWGYPQAFGLGIAEDGTRFCMGNGSSIAQWCKTLGFPQSAGGSPYGSWGTEYTE